MDILKKLRLHLFPQTIYRSKDKTFRIVDKMEYGHLVRVLYCNGVRESVIYLEEELKDEPLFYYMKTLKALCQMYVPSNRALLIGGGGMAFAKYYLNMSHVNTMTAVEKDERCIEIAGKYFGVYGCDRLNI